MVSYGTIWRGCCCLAGEKRRKNIKKHLSHRACKVSRKREKEGLRTKKTRTDISHQQVPMSSLLGGEQEEAEEEKEEQERRGGGSEKTGREHGSTSCTRSADRGERQFRGGRAERPRLGLRPRLLRPVTRSAYPEHIFEGDVSGARVLELLLHRMLHALPDRNKQTNKNSTEHTRIINKKKTNAF